MIHLVHFSGRICTLHHWYTEAPIQGGMGQQAGSTMEFDPFLGKESLAALGRMGFGKREARLGPHRYHGVAARTRLSVAGKVSRPHPSSVESTDDTRGTRESF